MKRRWIGGLAAFLAFGLACGDSEETVVHESDGVRVTQDGETVTFESEDGDIQGSFGEGATLPDGLPDDAPIPSDAKVVGSMQAPDGTMVTLEFDGSAEAAGDAVVEAFRNAGWNIDEDRRFMGQRVLAGSKGDRFASAQVMEAEGTVRAMVMLGTNPD